MQSDKLELFYDEDDEIQPSQTTQLPNSSSKQIEKVMSHATYLTRKTECVNISEIM
jgi:hypothetical protein